MLRHQLREPIDKDAHLRADVSVRRECDVQRHGIEVPAFEQWLQFSRFHMRLGHITRQPQNAHSSHAGSKVRVAIVDGDDIAAPHFHILTFGAQHD